MKILFYTNSFYPDPIGIAYYNTELVEELLRLGHEMEVITAMPYYPQWSVAEPYRRRWRVEEAYGNTTVTRTWVYVPRRQTAIGRFLCEFSFMISSFTVLSSMRARRNPPDVIMAVTPPFGVSLAAAIYSRWRRVPLWLHVQDLQVDAGQAVGFLRHGGIVHALLRLEKWIFRQAAVLTTITEAMRDRVIGKGIPESQVGLFPNWVNSECMRPLARDSAFRRDNHFDDQFVVLYAGNIGIHQGLNFLLQAAQRLEQERSIVFVVVGDGNYFDQFARQVEKEKILNVRVLPLQPKERLAEMLSSADIGLVMETRRMANLSMPSKILNQMACGRPVLAVTAPGTALAHLISKTGAGVVLPPSNADLLAMTVLNLKNSPDRLARMGQAARQYILEEAAAAQLLKRIPQFLRQATTVTSSTGPSEYRLKRILDIVLAAAGFVVSSPLWVLVPLIIWLEDQGPIFYRQRRVGRFGLEFDVYKFRSMRKEELPENDRRQARRGDPRVTHAGRWLRATAMDEVPQLWNILKGEMSFVGPRALLPTEIEVAEAYRGAVPLEKIPGSARRALMRPGLTGIAQVYAARDISRVHKFKYDLLYLRRQNIGLDIRLILRSGWNSLTARWEKIGHETVKVR